MNNSTYRFTLDLQKHQSQMSIAVYQYDNAVTLNISLTDGGKRYEIEPGSYVIFYGMRADDKPLIHKCELKDNTEIIYIFRNSTAYYSGIVNAQIRLYSATKKLITAPKFTILVEDRVVNEDDLEVADNDRLEALDQLFTDEQSRVEAEDERNEAEIARNIAEDARALAEIQRNQTVAEKLAEIQDGKTPYIQDGYWYIDGVNTGEKAQGTVITTSIPIKIIESDEEELTPEPNTLYMFTDDPVIELSPTVSLTKEGDKTTLSMTDKNGTQTVEIFDGKDRLLYRNIIKISPSGREGILVEYYSTSRLSDKKHSDCTTAMRNLTEIASQLGISDHLSTLAVIGGTYFNGTEYFIVLHSDFVNTDGKIHLLCSRTNSSTLTYLSVASSSLTYDVTSYIV